jgi:hypothetical protein
MPNITYEQFAEYRAKGALLEKEANVNDVVPSRTYVSQQSKDVVYDLTVGLDAQYPEYAQRYQTENPPIVQNLSDADVAKLLDDEPPKEDRLSNEEIIRLRSQGYKNEIEETDSPPSESQDDASSWKNTQNSVLTAIGAPTSSDTEDKDIQPYDEWGTESKRDTKPPPGEVTITPQLNPLHSYASYTYGISLHMLSRDDFNQMASDPYSDWNPTTTLIASGGKYGSVGFNRDPAFEDDFFFENLKITTIIGSTSGNQGTNAIDLSFTLIEPYGMTLIDRLIDACVAKTSAEGQGLVDGKNYTEIPYLLQIDFFGYDDDGIAYEIRSQRKYLPISLLGVKIKVGIKGAEYQIEASPYAHRAFQESIQGSPANFEVTASTLEEFFKPDINVSDLNKKYDERYEQYKKEKEKKAKEESPDTRDQEQDSGPSAGDSTYEVRSFVAAYNAWQSRLKENNVAQDFNTIRVVFDEEILKSVGGNGGKIIAPKAESVKQVATADPNNPKHKQQVAKANAGQQTAKPNLNINKFTFKTGTGVTQIINMMMLNSEYIRSQAIDATLDAEQNVDKLKKDVDWWKIVPSVQMRSFCTQTSTWYLDVTYHVVKKTVFNRTHPGLPQSLPTGVHKEYNYIYTGENYDIIDFSIEYDALWYTAVSIDKNKSQAIATTADEDNSDKDTNDPNVVEKNAAKAKNSPVQPKKRNPVAGQLATQSTGGATKDSVQTTVTSAADHLNNGKGADQLQVNLKIVGDPQFIKQDEVFSNPEARKLDPNDSADTGHVGGPDGSIDMDSREVHALLTWKTPVDIDEYTGGLRKNSKYTESVFSGIYQILKVDSTFAGGKFEQTLEMIRLPDQPRDYKDANSSRSLDERKVGKEQPSVDTEQNINRYESSTSNVTEPAQSAMNVASRNWTPTETASDESDGRSNQSGLDAETDSNPGTEYVDQTNRGVLSAITGNNNTPVETATADTFPPTQTPAEIISTSPVVKSSTSSPASSVTPDETPTPVGYGNTENITDAQIQSSPVYTQTYNNNVALGIPPLVAAQQASQAARQSIALGN